MARARLRFFVCQSEQPNAKVTAQVWSYWDVREVILKTGGASLRKGVVDSCPATQEPYDNDEPDINKRAMRDGAIQSYLIRALAMKRAVRPPSSDPIMKSG